jgi:RNA polymerase sigma factor (sigma-70 family)
VDPGDDDLIRRAQRGEERAYAMLVERHQQVAFRTAYAVCGDATEAEDAAQEAFVKAYRALGRFRAGSPWRPWLLRIVANEARNRRRSAGRREHLALRVASLVPEPEPAPDAAVLVRDERAELTAALGRLEPPHREVVVLRHVLELSEAECAAVLGVRPGTVKSRLSRALDRLREDLGER